MGVCRKNPSSSYVKGETQAVTRWQKRSEKCSPTLENSLEKPWFLLDSLRGHGGKVPLGLLEPYSRSNWTWRQLLRTTGSQAQLKESQYKCPLRRTQILHSRRYLSEFHPWEMEGSVCVWQGVTVTWAPNRSASRSSSQQQTDTQQKPRNGKEGFVQEFLSKTCCVGWGRWTWLVLLHSISLTQVPPSGSSQRSGTQVWIQAMVSVFCLEFPRTHNSPVFIFALRPFPLVLFIVHAHPLN